jgi:iron complex outermembrane receptor protein
MRIFIIIILLITKLNAQNCDLSLEGYVFDEHNDEGLELAVVVLEENQVVAYTDAYGKFVFQSLCPGEYHIQVNHLACETRSSHISLTKDTSIILYLEHHEEMLQSVTILEHKLNTQKSLAKASISGLELEHKQGGSLGDILKSVAGVNSLNTGGGLSKPIIHGLFGNRIQIMNNDVAIQGQQWGNEHAPEVDPFTIQKISIIKGASALKYGTRSMGGVVLIDSEDLPTDNHLHGSFSLLGFTNGLKLASSLKLEGGIKDKPFFKWRTQFSYSKSGDNNAANYLLSNTAREEIAGNVQVQYKKERSTTSLNFSIYQYQIGILRGSHIGNLSDLEEAFSRETPFFTEDRISYVINKPNQSVLHNTVQLNHLQDLKKGELNLSYNFQYNQRKEFDVRRSSDKASLFLNLQSQEVQISYKSRIKKLKYEFGSQYQHKLNFNDPDLNVQALIPNYTINQLSVFSIQELEFKRFVLDFGLRYEYQTMLAKYFEDGDMITPLSLFNNYAFSIGALHHMADGLSSRTNVSYISRSPEVNELYSSGLHHGAAAIELGNKNFTNERMWSVNQSFTFVKDDVFQIEVSPYYQFFYNYIQLNPQEELQLTIRGAFPVFSYESSKASIAGFDLGMRTQVYPHLYWALQSAIVRGVNLENNNPLSFMPADYIQNGFNYSMPLKKKLQEISFGLNGRNVWQQIRVPDFDFAAAPKGFFLLGAEIAGKLQFNKLRMNWQIEATNLLNVSYRDYLNRWRYFADDLGANIALRTKFIF